MRIYKVMASEGDWEQPLEELLTFAIMRETDKGMSEGFRKALGTFKGVSSEEIDWWCQSYIDNGKWRYVEPMSWLNLMQYTEPSKCLWVEPVDILFV